MSPYRERRPALSETMVRATDEAVRRHEHPLQHLGDTCISNDICPTWAKRAFTSGTFEPSLKVWFVDDRTVQWRQLEVEFSQIGLVAYCGLADFVVETIRDAVAPWPLLCDAKSFRRRALRWFRRASA